MPVAQSPAHFINSSRGCPSITESFPLCFILVLCPRSRAALPVVEPHSVAESLNPGVQVLKFKFASRIAPERP
jgi:hypothetical protein